ncbi:MAG: hypothetical protein ACRES4_09105 [Nevskiales bacterium]
MTDVLDRFPAPLGPLVGLRVIRLTAGDDYAQPLEAGNQAWVQVIEGLVHVCGRELHKGQGVLLQKESVLAGYAETDCVLLIIELKQDR